MNPVEIAYRNRISTIDYRRPLKRGGNTLPKYRSSAGQGHPSPVTRHPPPWDYDQFEPVCSENRGSEFDPFDKSTKPGTS